MVQIRQSFILELWSRAQISISPTTPSTSLSHSSSHMRWRLRMKKSGIGKYRMSRSHRSKFVHITCGFFGNLSSFSSDFPSLSLSKDSGRYSAELIGDLRSCFGKPKYPSRSEQNVSKQCSIFSAASLQLNLWRVPASCGGTEFATTGIVGTECEKEVVKIPRCRTSCSRRFPPSFFWTLNIVRRLRFTGWVICTTPRLRRSFNGTSKPILR